MSYPTRKQTSDAIDRSAGRRQDISESDYVGPVGDQGWSLVTLPGSDRPILVNSALGSKTFRPGDKVLVASVSAGGTGGPYTIVGPPPPGSAGTGASAPRSQPAPPAPSLGPSLMWGLFLDSGAGLVRAVRYTGRGAFVAEVNTLGVDPATVDNPICIVHDSAGIMGDGSYVFRAGETPMSWDPAAGTSFSPTIPGGSVATAAVFWGGWAYWGTIPAASSTVSGVNSTTATIWRARADFSSASAVGTITLSNVGGVSAVTWTARGIFATLTAVHVLVAWQQSPVPEIGGAVWLALPLAGGSVTQADATLDPGTVLVGVPEIGGGAVQIVNKGTGVVTLSRAPEAPSPAFAELWPLDWEQFTPWFNASVSPDLKRGSLYGVTTGGDFTLYAGPLTAPFGTIPPVRVIVGQIPAVSDWPSFLYWGG